MTIPESDRDQPAQVVDDLLDNPTPIRPEGRYQALLERLQGNILKGHGRDFTVNIFMRFECGASTARIREELARLAGGYVTSAARQLKESEERRTWGLPGTLFGNLFLSKTTYERLDLVRPPEGVSGSRETPSESRLADSHFLAGMRAVAGDLGDSIPDPVEPLEQAYARGDLDALLLLADDSDDHLLRTARRVVDEIQQKGVATVVAVERGSVLRNSDGQGVEHFGYVDGRSQPLFLESDFVGLDGEGRIVPGTTKERVGDALGDVRHWNPFARLKLVLVKDPGVRDPFAYGSYYVFRKLEQNVQGFARAEQALAGELGLKDGDGARAGAMAVGRFRDGTPLVLSDRPGLPPHLSNDFQYDQPPDAQVDRFGLKCPFQAHIRKVSPRQTEAAADALERRIARRAVTYGRRTSLDMANGLDDLPAGGVGLLFACFQRSIVDQFGFMQTRWSNAAHFPIQTEQQNHVGLDVVVGQGNRSSHRWRVEFGGTIEEPENLAGLEVPKTHRTSFRFESFVKFRGGEFFFAPSLPFLLGE